MKPERPLVLKKELLAELTADEMTRVVAAGWTPGCHLTIELSEKISQLESCQDC